LLVVPQETQTLLYFRCKEITVVLQAVAVVAQAEVLVVLVVLYLRQMVALVVLVLLQGGCQQSTPPCLLAGKRLLPMER
jgi:hypothetical protein